MLERNSASHATERTPLIQKSDTQRQGNRDVDTTCYDNFQVCCLPVCGLLSSVVSGIASYIPVFGSTVSTTLYSYSSVVVNSAAHVMENAEENLHDSQLREAMSGDSSLVTETVITAEHVVRAALDIVEDVALVAVRGTSVFNIVFSPQQQLILEHFIMRNIHTLSDIFRSFFDNIGYGLQYLLRSRHHAEAATNNDNIPRQDAEHNHNAASWTGLFNWMMYAEPRVHGNEQTSSRFHHGGVLESSDDTPFPSRVIDTYHSAQQEEHGHEHLRVNGSHAAHQQEADAPGYQYRNSIAVRSYVSYHEEGIGWDS